MQLNIYVLQVIAESDARGEDDLRGREAEVMRFQVALEGNNGWGELISRGIGFQMVGAEQRKERELKLMLDGVGKR